MNRQNGTPGARSRLSTYLLYAFFPFVLIGILEVILRLTGVGNRIPLFVPAPTPGYMQPNEAVIKRFFFNPAEAPDVRIDTTYFLKDKPKDAIRIVVQGASTAAGFPFGRAASIAVMLQQRVQRAYPDRTVEVISTAIPAINSFALLDFEDEIADIDPDAVVIYAGHNEFLGDLGAASAADSNRSPGFTRLVLNLRKLNLIEAGFQVYGAGTVPLSRSGEALMSRMGRNRTIAYGSVVFAAGHRQFRENLSLLLDHYRGDDIPVFVGTLASNESDLAPFRPSDLNMSVASRWNDAQKAFAAAVRANNPREANIQAGLLVKLAPENAMSWYVQGKAELLRARPSEARHAFLRAKDLDELRFRAPESFNDIIRSAALEYGTTLVDVQQVLAVRSADRIIGAETMVDHLHPNVDGYFSMAEAFYKAIADAGILGPPESEPGRETARGEIPVTEIDRLYGEWQVQRLLHDWPFVERDQSYSPPAPKTPIERMARAWYDGRISWMEAMNRGLAYYRKKKDADKTGRYAASLALAMPFDPGTAYLAGSNLLATGDPGWALPHLERAVRLEPHNTVYLMSLAEDYDVLGRPHAALAVLNRLLEIEHGHSAAAALGSRIRQRLLRGSR